MFLKIENKIINLDLVKIIGIGADTNGFWSIQILAENEKSLFEKKFKSEKEAVDYLNKLSKLLEPKQFKE